MNVFLKPGDVFDNCGRRYIVDYVNECRARALYMTREVHAGVTRFGDPFEFSTAKGPISVCATIERDAILERRGRRGLEDFLAARKTRSRGADDNNSGSEGEQEMRKTVAKDKTKMRGGLAADVARRKSEEHEKKRSDIKKVVKPVTKVGSTRRLNEFEGHSICSVLNRLGVEGVRTSHVRAIAKARRWKCAPETIRLNVMYGKHGKGLAASLTDEQVERLVGTCPDNPD